MPTYFYRDGQEQFGPFTIDTLREKRILPQTPVWKEGLPDWVIASELPELQDLLHVTPPPFKIKLSATEKLGIRIGRGLGIVGLCLLVILLVVLIHNDRSGNFNLTQHSFIDLERTNPANFVLAEGTYRTNFWGNKYVINAIISNNASHTNYKDVRLKVNFYSQTNTLIDSKEYIVYDYFPYGLKKTVNLTIDKPSAAATCGWQAINATVY